MNSALFALFQGAAVPVSELLLNEDAFRAGNLGPGRTWVKE